MGKLYTVVFLVALIYVVAAKKITTEDYDKFISGLAHEIEDQIIERSKEFAKPVEDEPVEDEPVEDAPVEDAKRKKKKTKEPVEKSTVTVAGKECAFPFIYGGKEYKTCTTVNNGNTPWCATTHDYGKDHKWGNCKLVLTSSGDYCTFPFKYGKKKYSHCITKRHSSAWCATGKNYKKDHKWANCLLSGAVMTSVKGQLCHFPFTYKGKQYTTCIIENSSNGWCSLTADYDKDKKYGYCLRNAKSKIVDEGKCEYPFSKEQCEAYATKGNHAFANVHSSQTETFPAGCYLRYKTGTTEVMKAYFNEGSANSAPCGTHGRHCICN